MNKDRRVHIHQTIDGLGIPVTHHTEHQGSPHKLILTKTKELPLEAKRRFEKVSRALGKLTKKTDKKIKTYSEKVTEVD